MKSTEKTFDGLLVVRCISGDKKAYSLLVKQWHQKFCKQAYWYTKNGDLAKDIAQESWTVIFKKLHMLKDPSSFGSWALSIVNRKAVDAVRKTARSDKKLKDYYKDLKTNNECYKIDKTITNDNYIVDVDYSEVIIKMIKELPKDQQIVLRLFYVEEYSVVEISELLRIAKGTVKSRLFYAREKLKSNLKQYRDEKS